MTAPDRQDTFSSQRLTLSYVEWGEPSAPPLVLVHGGRDQKRSWDRVAARLAETYRVIAFDLRGHGTRPSAQNAGRASVSAADGAAQQLD